MTEPDHPEPRLAPTPVPSQLLAGRYRLDRPLASGGMAEVWVATDEVLARRVAIKLLHRHLAGDASFVRRFRAEAVAAARLAHPSIVSIYDTFDDQGLQGIVMELVVGTTMRADLDEHGPMRLEAVLAIGTQVADALGAAHQSGLVHRDVKPANILLAKDGRVLVADFGIAKAAETGDLTVTGAMIGTAKYLAPEQVEGGPIDARADLYALGVVLYEALTGTPPFVAETDAGTALARLHRDPQPPRELRPEIPVPVEAVVLQALARDRAHRFASAAAMRRALLHAGAEPERAPAVAAEAAAGAGHLPAAPVPSHQVADPSAGTTLEPPPPPAPRAPRRRGRRWLLAIVVLLAAAGLGVVLLGRGSDARPLEVAAVRSFDPQGDNRTENEELAPAAIDGDPDTAWRSERYNDPASIAGKDGVGLALTLADPAQLTSIDITTPTGGWAAQVYVVSGAEPQDLAGWGDAVASVTDAGDGTTRLSLRGSTGDGVLIWFTRLAPNGSVEVSDVTVQGR